MGATLFHAFNCTVEESGTSGTSGGPVGPNEWNAAHQFYLGVNAQTGTSYTFVAGDDGNLVTFSNSSAVAVTLPQAASGAATIGAALNFYQGWFVFAENLGTGLVTITPTTSTIGSNTSLALAQGAWALILSDGTNYQVMATGNAVLRHAVADANYSVTVGISVVAYTSITAARTVSLPASSSFSPGTTIRVVDESGSCSATKTITINPNGSDTINGAASVVINQPYGYVTIGSNASGKWTVVDQGPMTLALNGLTGELTLAATDGSVISASGTTCQHRRPRRHG